MPSSQCFAGANLMFDLLVGTGDNVSNSIFSFLDHLLLQTANDRQFVYAICKTLLHEANGIKVDTVLSCLKFKYITEKERLIIPISMLLVHGILIF